MSIASIIEDFEVLEDWEDRYRYLIDLGRALPPLLPHEKTEETRVQGCTAQVWLLGEQLADGAWSFRGESDAAIVQGLVAVLLAFYHGHSGAEIAAMDAKALFAQLGLEEHLSPTRSNGFFAMVERVQGLVGQG